MNENEIIELFLMDRDKRVEHQEELLKKYKGSTLATVRVNYPGIEKSNFITDSIVKIICNEISIYHRKEIIFTEEYKSREGYIGHFIFNDNHNNIKKAMINLEENHILGRCVDIDVYYLKKDEKYGFDQVIGMSRSDLTLTSRKCFLCDEEARVCSRAQSHSLEEIKKYFEEKFEEYNEWIKQREALAYDISQLALKGIISEVSTIPSFGLVSPSTMGSHKDMDYYTFLDSSFAIVPYLKEMALIGYSYKEPKEIFKAIRKVGVACENAMFSATKGVNTHKGMIFLVGITVAAVMKTLYEKQNFNRIQEIIKAMCEDILSDFENIDTKSHLTHGEKLYRDYGFTGIRGEVKAGLPIVFNSVLPRFISSKVNGHDLYSETLLYLMAEVEDSTIVHRQNISKLKEIQLKSKEILEMGGLQSDIGRKAALDFEEQCINDNVSPGGSADMLALIIFLGEVYNKYFS